MMPGYVRQIAPDYRGRQYAGLADHASAGIGQAIAGVGAGLVQTGEQIAQRGDMLAASRAWRELDSWRVQYFRDLPKRRGELAATSIDDVTGSNVTGYDKELSAFPDALKTKFEELSTGLSSSARARLELAYNQAVPQWSDEAVRTLDAMELSDVTAEARDLARNGRSADALDLVDLYRDRMGPEAARQLATELQVSGAQADLQEIARTQGWQAAHDTLKDPEWQKIYGLDVGEAASIRNQLGGFVAEESARQERADAMAQDLLSRQRIDEAYQGTVDIDTVRREYLTGQLSEKAYNAVRQLSITGPRKQNDPQVYAKLIELQDAVQRGAKTSSDLKTFAFANAAALKSSTFEAAISQAENPFAMQQQAKNDAVQRAYGQFVRIREEDLASLLIAGVSGEQMKSAADERASQLNLVNMLSDELEEWIGKNPGATRAEILRQARGIQVSIANRSVEDQDAMIRQWQGVSPGALPDSGVGFGIAGNLGNIANQMRQAQTNGQQASAPPAGLESIWTQLDAEAQADVLRLMARGKTAAEILRIWQEGR